MLRNALLTLAALVLTASCVWAQSKFVTEFRGMKFGSDISQIERLAPRDKGNDLKIYKRYQDDQTFQGLPIKDLSYGFYKGKFCIVLFSATGPTAFNTFKSYFDATYGQPIQASKNSKMFVYPCGEVNIELGYDDNQKVVAVQYTHVALFNQMQADIKAGRAKP